MSTVPFTGSTTVSDSLARCAIAVAAYFGALFGSLEGIADRVGEGFAASGPMSAATLSELVHPLAAQTLAEHPIVGGGFVATPGWLTDREHFLAWWQGEDQAL